MGSTVGECISPNYEVVRLADQPNLTKLPRVEDATTLVVELHLVKEIYDEDFMI